MIAKTRKQPKIKCTHCYGLGLDADLWGAGYRFATKKEHNSRSPRINCDRCGVGATPGGEACAEASLNRNAARLSKEAAKRQNKTTD